MMINRNSIEHLLLDVVSRNPKASYRTLRESFINRRSGTQVDSATVTEFLKSFITLSGDECLEVTKVKTSLYESQFKSINWEEFREYLRTNAPNDPRNNLSNEQIFEESSIGFAEYYSLSDQGKKLLEDLGDVEVKNISWIS